MSYKFVAKMSLQLFSFHPKCFSKGSTRNAVTIFSHTFYLEIVYDVYKNKANKNDKCGNKRHNSQQKTSSKT